MGKIKKQQEQPEDVRAKILAGAKEIFTRKGYAAARMQEIADTAGVNKGLLHYYKWNKEKLFLAVFEEAFTEFALRANAIIESNIPLAEKIEAFVDKYLDLLLENPNLPAFVIHELNHNPEAFLNNLLTQKARPNIAKLILQVQLEAQAGRIRDINAFHFLLNLMGLCVFPFLARPLFTTMVGIEDAAYMGLMQTRKKEIVEFVLNAIRL